MTNHPNGVKPEIKEETEECNGGNDAKDGLGKADSTLTKDEQFMKVLRHSVNCRYDSYIQIIQVTTVMDIRETIFFKVGFKSLSSIIVYSKYS